MRFYLLEESYDKEKVYKMGLDFVGILPLPCVVLYWSVLMAAFLQNFSWLLVLIPFRYCNVDQGSRKAVMELAVFELLLFWSCWEREAKRIEMISRKGAKMFSMVFKCTKRDAEGSGSGVHVCWCIEGKCLEGGLSGVLAADICCGDDNVKMFMVKDWRWVWSED